MKYNCERRFMEPAPIYRPPSEPGKPVADPAIWTGQGLAADASWQLPLSDGAPKDIKFLAAHIRPRGADDPRKLLTLTHADLPIGLLAQTRDALGLAVIRGISVQG